MLDHPVVAHHVIRQADAANARLRHELMEISVNRTETDAGYVGLNAPEDILGGRMIAGATDNIEHRRKLSCLALFHSFRREIRC